MVGEHRQISQRSACTAGALVVVLTFVDLKPPSTARSSLSPHASQRRPARRRIGRRSRSQSAGATQERTFGEPARARDEVDEQTDSEAAILAGSSSGTSPLAAQRSSSGEGGRLATGGWSSGFIAVGRYRAGRPDARPRRLPTPDAPGSRPRMADSAIGSAVSDSNDAGSVKLRRVWTEPGPLT